MNLFLPDCGCDRRREALKEWARKLGLPVPASPMPPERARTAQDARAAMASYPTSRNLGTDG